MVERMPSRIVTAVLVAATLVLASCGDSDDSDSAERADDTTITTEVETTATTADTEDEEDMDAEGLGAGEPGVCPDVGTPDEIASTAPVSFDGNGDGQDDTLTTFQEEGTWWIGVEWAAGGSGWIMLDDAGPMGATALGGHDLDGDGVDEAFIAFSGPASGHVVHVYQQDVCGLKPIEFGNGEPFSFPVTATAGTMTSAECGSPTDISLVTSLIVDPDTGTVDVERVSYSFQPDEGVMRGEEEAYDTIEGADLSELSGLRCGDLDSAFG